MITTDEKIEILQDFSGGLDTLTAPNRLDPKRQPTHSNVWNDTGAIVKKNGAIVTTTTPTIFGQSFYVWGLHTSAFSSTQNLLMLVNIVSPTARNFLLYTTVDTGKTVMNTGGTGTASSAVASPTITGSGTNWNTTAAAGALFIIGNTIGQIQSVDSDTQLTLTSNFGALNTGVAYTITQSYASSLRLSYVDMNNKCWICSTGGTTVSFDGTTQSLVTAFPKANYSIIYKNYVFAANYGSTPSRISWSALKDPTTWPGSNFIDITPDDGFPIVGLFYDGQSIVILKTNSAYKLTGDAFDPANPTYTLTAIYTPTDFIMNSPKSVQLFGQSYIMLGKKGFYSYDGSGAIYKILNYDIIRDQYAQISSFNWSLVPNITVEPCSIIVDGNYWLQVPNANSSISTVDKELTYVIDKNGSIWRWQATSGSGMISDFAYFNNNLYGGNSDTSGGTAGLIKLNTGTSDQGSTAINGTITTKVYEFQNFQRFGKANVVFKKQSAGNLTFEYSIDEGSFTSVTIDMTAGTGTRVKSSDILVGQVGYSIQFRLSNNVAAQVFEIYAVQFSHADLEN